MRAQTRIATKARTRSMMRGAHIMVEHAMQELRDHALAELQPRRRDGGEPIQITLRKVRGQDVDIDKIGKAWGIPDAPTVVSWKGVYALPPMREWWQFVSQIMSRKDSILYIKALAAVALYSTKRLDNAVELALEVMRIDWRWESDIPVALRACASQWAEFGIAIVDDWQQQRFKMMPVGDEAQIKAAVGTIKQMCGVAHLRADEAILRARASKMGISLPPSGYATPEVTS